MDQFKDSAHHFEWRKRHGSLNSTNAKLDKNMIHFQPFEASDVDVYTCFAHTPSQTMRKSIAFNYKLEAYLVHRTSHKAPYIIDIYQSSIQSVGNKYELDCVTGKLFIFERFFFHTFLFKSAIFIRY